MISLVATAGNAQVSDAPDAAFKLATFGIDGRERVGMLIDDRLLDVQQANELLVKKGPGIDNSFLGSAVAYGRA